MIMHLRRCVCFMWLAMQSYSSLMSLLGKSCCWRSTTTGALVHGFIVAVRADERVQTSPSLYNIDNSLCWRPLPLIMFCQPIISPAQASSPLMQLMVPAERQAASAGASECAVCVNEHSILPTENALDVRQPVTPHMSQLQLADAQSNNAWAVYVRNLPTDVPENLIAADFSADSIEMRGNAAAILRFNTQQKAKDAMKWNRAKYHGRYINVKWSTT